MMVMVIMARMMVMESCLRNDSKLSYKTWQPGQVSFRGTGGIRRTTRKRATSSSFPTVRWFSQIFYTWPEENVLIQIDITCSCLILASLTLWKHKSWPSSEELTNVKGCRWKRCCSLQAWHCQRGHFWPCPIPRWNYSSRFVTELLQIADMSLFCESRTRERREASTGWEREDPSLPQVRDPPPPEDQGGPRGSKHASTCLKNIRDLRKLWA